MARDFRSEYAARNERARELGFSSYNEQRKLRADAAEAGITGGKRIDVAARDVYALTAREAPSADRNRRVVRLAVEAGISPRRILQLLPQYGSAASPGASR